jgi:hypothetical protein
MAANKAETNTAKPDDTSSQRRTSADGLTEPENAAGESFGDRKLEEVIRDNRQPQADYFRTLAVGAKVTLTRDNPASAQELASGGNGGIPTPRSTGRAGINVPRVPGGIGLATFPALERKTFLRCVWLENPQATAAGEAVQHRFVASELLLLKEFPCYDSCLG